MNAHDARTDYPRQADMNGAICEAVLAYTLELEETARADKRLAGWLARQPIRPDEIYQGGIRYIFN